MFGGNTDACLPADQIVGALCLANLRKRQCGAHIGALCDFANGTAAIIVFLGREAHRGLGKHPVKRFFQTRGIAQMRLHAFRLLGGHISARRPIMTRSNHFGIRVTARDRRKGGGRCFVIFLAPGSEAYNPIAHRGPIAGPRLCSACQFTRCVVVARQEIRPGDPLLPLGACIGCQAVLVENEQCFGIHRAIVLDQRQNLGRKATRCRIAFSCSGTSPAGRGAQPCQFADFGKQRNCRCAARPGQSNQRGCIGQIRRDCCQRYQITDFGFR